MSKRLLLARSMQAVGLTRVLEFLKAKPGLLIINHHRIGEAEQTRFDRGVFSASGKQLDAQLTLLKRHAAIVCGDELEALVMGETPLDRLYAAFTFDDGYLDNYTNAFGLMKSHGCGGAFFVVPDYVGTATIPWWDAIAYSVRNSRRETISLDVPARLEVQMAGDREQAILQVLRHYKRPDNMRPEEFLAQLQAQTQCDVPAAERRFLSWEEAAEMQRAGMVIGSHTVSHRILSQLTAEEQQCEMAVSKALIEEKLGGKVRQLAYPVGGHESFSTTTEELARAAGYRACFSFFGGVNTAEDMQPMNIKRMGVDPDPMMFRNQMAWMTRLGKVPYA